MRVFSFGPLPYPMTRSSRELCVAASRRPRACCRTFAVSSAAAPPPGSTRSSNCRMGSPSRKRRAAPSRRRTSSAPTTPVSRGRSAPELTPRPSPPRPAPPRAPGATHAGRRAPSRATPGVDVTFVKSLTFEYRTYLRRDGVFECITDHASSLSVPISYLLYFTF